MRVSFRGLLQIALLLLVPLAGLKAEDKPSAAAAESPATKPDEVLVRGTNLTILRRDLNGVYQRIQTGLMNVGQLLPADRQDQVQAQLLDQMIFMRLCEARATEPDRTRAKFESDAFIRGLRDSAAGEDAFQRQLVRAGYSEERFLKDKYSEALTTTVVDRELKSNVTIPDDEVKKVYTDNPERWTKPESARVIHLLISTRDPVGGQELPEEAKKEKLKTIQALRERVLKGEDFSALIKQFSEDAASRARGGEYVFARGQMVVEFEGATFTMSAGQLSDVVTTQFGYHLIKLLEKKAPSQRTFEEVSKTIREDLIDREVKKRLPDYAALLRKEAGVELAATAPKALAEVAPKPAQ